MVEFTRAGQERINVFWVDEMYLFKHYFDGDQVFAQLADYYNNQQYRFELPPGEFSDIREFLEGHGYTLAVVDSVEDFVVVVKKYTDHPENIFKASVIQRSVDGYNCFLLTDRAAVEEAVADGARRLTETTLENPYSSD